MPNRIQEKLKATELSSAARAEERKLIVSLTQTDLLSSCYAHKSRVKPAEKLIEKVRIKKQEPKKRNYKLEDITDVIGLRFVTLFRAEMPEVIKQVMELILHQADLSPNPFSKKDVEEIIIYTTNSSNDSMIGEVKEALKPFALKEGTLKIVSSKEGYSSIHIVTRLSKKIKVDGIDESYRLPVELQIRTVFEDAWGEIDHKYGYIIRANKAETEAVHNPESVLAHLKVLKKVADACGEYADLIHKEATAGICKPIEEINVISVGSDDDIIDRLKELDVPRLFITQYSKARKLRHAGEKLVARSAPNAQYELSLAAQAFKELVDAFIDGIPGDVEDEKKEYLMYYYAKMNEAFCLLSTKKHEDITVAQSIYHGLELTYPDFPLVKHRLGQTYGMLGDLDRCISSYMDAKTLMEQYEKEGKVGNDVLPLVDYNHIVVHMRICLGYYLWKKTEREGVSIEERVELLDQAIDITKPLISSKKEQHKAFKAYNNLLYYSIEKHYLLEERKESCCEIEEEIKVYLDGMLKNTIEGEMPRITWLDTLSKGYSLIGNHQEAKRIADEIVELALEPEKNNDSQDPRSVLKIAREARTLSESIQKK